MVGVSYAWWTHTVSQEGINTIQSTCLEIELADENPITLQNAYPITDAEASLLTPYTFIIKNKCNTMLEYDVNLDIMESNNRLSSSYIAIEFNGEEKKLLNTLESVETSYPKTDYTPIEGRYLTSGTLDSNESKSYSLKLWMDESVTVEDEAMNKSFVSKVVVTAKQSHKVRLVDYVMSDNETEEFKHEATYQTPALIDYRYTGSNPNNYVCFGSEEEICPSDNLYRIIGVMPTQNTIDGEYENRVKLIKDNYYTETKSGLLLTGSNSNWTAPGGKGYRWNNVDSNKWEESSLQINVLNGVYWNSLGEYQKYIALAKWYLGAHGPSSQGLEAEQLYKIERSSTKGYSQGTIYYVNNIGLIYYSDTVFSRWVTEKLVNTTDREWTICPTVKWTYDIAYAIFTSKVGGLSHGAVLSDPNTIFGVRPTFYLKANVLYESGNGSQENPFRISINE